jgi:hypothetical protein
MSDDIGKVRRLIGADLGKMDETITIYYAGWPLPNQRLLGELAIPNGATLVVECTGDCKDDWGKTEISVGMRGIKPERVNLAQNTLVSEWLDKITPPHTSVACAFFTAADQDRENEAFVVYNQARIGVLGLDEVHVLEVRLIQHGQDEWSFIDALKRGQRQLQRASSGSTDEERKTKYFGELTPLGILAYSLIRAEDELALRILQKSDPMFHGFRELDLICQFLRLRCDWASLRRWVAVQAIKAS